MAQGPVVFGNAQGEANQELSGSSPLAVNVLTDGKGTVRRRPAIVAYTGTAPATAIDANGITGLYANYSGQLYAVGGGPGPRSMYLLHGGASVNLATDVVRKLLGSTRPTFCENSQYTFVTGGGVPNKIAKSDSTATRLGGSPPQSTHIIANASRLLSNDSTSAVSASYVRYSGTGVTGIETWTASRFFNAEARPDPIVALAENSNEIFAFGSSTLQVYAPDGTFIYMPARTRNNGCIAPYSVVRYDESFAWLDDQRRIMLSDGRSVKELSTPIAGVLDKMSVTSDCFGFRMATDQYDCMVWVFPTDGRTFAWQAGAGEDGGWSQWHGYTGGNFSALPVGAFHFRQDTNENVVGLTDGTVCKLDSTSNADTGGPLVAYVLSGFLNRGTDNRKHCKSLKLALRRGEGSTGSTQCLLSWRDDTGAWNTPYVIDLGASGGDRNPIVEFRSLGVYRRRQWRIEFSDGDEVVLSSAAEEYDILDT